MSYYLKLHTHIHYINKIVKGIRAELESIEAKLCTRSNNVFSLKTCYINKNLPNTVKIKI